MNRNIKLLTWFNFFTDFKLYAPVAIIYFSQVSGSFALGMAIFSIAMVSSALFEIPTGIFSDMIGRKKTVILGAISAVLYVVFYALGTSFIFLAIGALFVHFIAAITMHSFTIRYQVRNKSIYMKSI